MENLWKRVTERGHPLNFLVTPQQLGSNPGPEVLNMAKNKVGMRVLQNNVV
jgi:hypothetical protein